MQSNQPAFQRGLHMTAYGVWCSGVLLHTGSQHCWALAWWWHWAAHGSNPLSICALSLPGIRCYGWTALFCPSFSDDFLNFVSSLLHWQKFCFPLSRGCCIFSFLLDCCICWLWASIIQCYVLGFGGNYMMKYESLWARSWEETRV